MVSVLAAFILSIVACGGGSDPAALAKEMIKINEDYTAALKKVASKDDLIKAMKPYISSMTGLMKKVQEAMKKDPKAMKNMKDKDLEKKVQETMKNMMQAQMAENVMKYMTDPEVQKLSQEMQKVMQMK